MWQRRDAVIQCGHFTKGTWQALLYLDDRLNRGFESEPSLAPLV